jgi:hypothetical protein
MKLLSHKALLLALALGSLIHPSKVFADIPGYVGVQSFRLTDDRDFANILNAAENAKIDFARLDQSRSQLQDQVNTLSNEFNKIKLEMDQLNTQIQSDKASLKTAEEKMVELKKNADVNKDEIEKLQASIDRFNTLIKNASLNYGQLKLQLAPVATRLDQVKNDLDTVTKRAVDARNRMLQINQEKENYERQLVADIQRINRDGANRGGNDGQVDGSKLAAQIGYDSGNRDGNNDGFSVGTSDGQARDYRRGADQGDRDGSARARIDGERDGTFLGTRDGNISAANREGDIAGVNRANGSDASKVGTNQGNVAGLDRAKRVGRIDGEAKGETETLNKYESTPLTEVKLDGPFAGSFSRRSPAYPGDFNGPSFHPDVWVNKDILKRAYADGYIYIYRDQTRRAYINNIDSLYNRSYDQSYNSSYQSAFNRDYPDHYNAGRNDGDKRAYDRDYPIIRGNFYRDFYAKFDQSPNRSASEFKSTFAEAEPRAYARRYEEIRKAYFDQAELATFNANISAQTEIFRQKRIGEVTKIYNENAILMFTSSEMLDGGISGVAKLDGIFQAGESTLHNVVIKNFGFKAASSVRVKLDNGAEVALPAIPARSTVTIIGAGKSEIGANASLGSTQKTSLKVLSNLTSDDAIEAIHFDSIGGGVLKSSDVKSAKVQFPFSLSSLRLDSLLLKDAKNKLKISIANNSIRPYVGELKVEILVNSQNEIVTKGFSALAGLKNGTASELNDAEVLVTTDADIYRDLSFSAKLSQNGVVIGVLGSDLNTMAKASYSDKGKLPVIVVDSNANLNTLLDTLNDFGGSEKVSILDLSLTSLNTTILNSGLSNKAVVVLDDAASKSTASLNTLFAKSKNAGFVLVNENGSSLGVALSLPSFKDAQKLNLDKRQLAFTNPFRAEGVVGTSSFLASTRQGLLSVMPIVSTLGLTASEHLAKLKSEINRNSFFTPNDSIKLFNLRAMVEILNINIAYDKSGSIFSRDKKWADKVSDDNDLFLNQLKNASSGGVSEEKLGLVLSALSLKDFMGTAMSDFYDIQRNMMPKILNATNKVLGNIEDGFKKSLKDFNKDLYNKAYAQASIQRPFYIEPKPQPN